MNIIDFKKVSSEFTNFLSPLVHIDFQTFHNKLCEIIDKNEKTVTISTRKSARRQWATADFVDLVEERDFWRKRYENFPNDDNIKKKSK
jgi:hypothetical protein